MMTNKAYERAFNIAIKFHTKKFTNIDKVARDAIDDYLDFCARVGKEPEKPNV